MSAPKRIQRKCTKGWRMPEGAVYVGRPTPWGNPWAVQPVSRSGPFDVLLDGEFRAQSTGIEGARRIAVERYRAHLTTIEGRVAGIWTPTPAAIRAELAGCDLACWCPLSAPCHADVLLEIANTPAPHPDGCLCGDCRDAALDRRDDHDTEIADWLREGAQ